MLGRLSSTLKYFRQLVRHGGITSLNISGSKLSDVSTDTLKSVLRKMKLLRVENCRFSETQVNTIFQQISEGESELESLYIGNNRLTGARPELLRGAVPRLESPLRQHQPLSRSDNRDAPGDQGGGGPEAGGDQPHDEQHDSRQPSVTLSEP